MKTDGEVYIYRDLLLFFIADAC